MTLDRRAIVTYRQLGVAVEYPARASNLRRLHGALIALRARRIGSTKPESGVLELDTDFGGIDVHLKPPGAPAYADLRARALRLELEGPVLVAGLDDLIAMKRAAGRLIDRRDIMAMPTPLPRRSRRR